MKLLQYEPYNPKFVNINICKKEKEMTPKYSSLFSLGDSLTDNFYILVVSFY